jgi:hypothetical protein
MMMVQYVRLAGYSKLFYQHALDLSRAFLLSCRTKAKKAADIQ